MVETWVEDGVGLELQLVKAKGSCYIQTPSCLVHWNSLQLHMVPSLQSYLSKQKDGQRFNLNTLKRRSHTEEGGIRCRLQLPAQQHSLLAILGK